MTREQALCYYRVLLTGYAACVKRFGMDSDETGLAADSIAGIASIMEASGCTAEDYNREKGILREEGVE